MDRESQERWDKENMTTVNCRLTKQKAIKFKQACQDLGTNMNAVLLKAVNETIGEAEKRGC